MTRRQRREQGHPSRQERDANVFVIRRLSSVTSAHPVTLYGIRNYKVIFIYYHVVNHVEQVYILATQTSIIMMYLLHIKSILVEPMYRKAAVIKITS